MNDRTLIGFICAFLVVIAMFSSTSGAGASPPDSELITTRVSRADIAWLRSANVDWDGCEAGAPMIEPPSDDGDDRLDALLPVFFLHARFEPGIYDIGACLVPEFDGAGLM